MPRAVALHRQDAQGPPFPAYQLCVPRPPPASLPPLLKHVLDCTGPGHTRWPRTIWGLGHLHLRGQDRQVEPRADAALQKGSGQTVPSIIHGPAAVSAG